MFPVAHFPHLSSDSVSVCSLALALAPVSVTAPCILTNHARLKQKKQNKPQIGSQSGSDSRGSLQRAGSWNWPIHNRPITAGKASQWRKPNGW